VLILKKTQEFLEERYGLKTGLDVRDFVKFVDACERPQLLIQQGAEDIDLALILDRDIETASTPSPQDLSALFEEVSHFVYLAFNHQRGRNITPMELELQSEIDRVLVAFHSPLKLESSSQDYILESLHKKTYALEHYERARLLARQFLTNLAAGNPKAWSRSEFSKLSDFFHSDLARKIHLASK
jgi:hypothetical protein